LPKGKGRRILWEDTRDPDGHASGAVLLAGFMLFGVILMAFDTLVLGFFMFTSALR